MTDATTVNTMEVSETSPDIVMETVDRPVGALTGNVKWFNQKIGYGFLTVQSEGDLKGKDIFCHHTGICPVNSKFRTLIKGEYINFDVEEGKNGIQAVNITGIGGGALMCDNNISYTGLGPIPSSGPVTGQGNVLSPPGRKPRGPPFQAGFVPPHYGGPLGVNFMPPPPIQFHQYQGAGQGYKRPRVNNGGNNIC
jgi:CspA family cold shock protein